MTWTRHAIALAILPLALSGGLRGAWALGQSPFAIPICCREPGRLRGEARLPALPPLAPALVLRQGARRRRPWATWPEAEAAWAWAFRAEAWWRALGQGLVPAFPSLGPRLALAGGPGLWAMAPAGQGPLLRPTGAAGRGAKAPGAEGLPPAQAAVQTPWAEAPQAEAPPPPEEDGPGQTSLLWLEGLRCAACVRPVEAALRAVPGVHEAQVELTAQRAWVRHGAWVAPEALVRAVEAAGFGARLGRPGEQEGALRDADRAWGQRFAVAAFATLAAMFLGEPAAWGMQGLAVRLAAWAALVVATAGAAYAGGPFLAAALRRDASAMDRLIAMGLVASLGAAYLAVRQGQPGWADALAMYAALLAGGRWMEAALRRRAALAVDRLVGARPLEALRVVDGQEERVPWSALAAGDRLLVKAGERLPGDGAMEAGEAAVAEDLLSGELRPRPVRPGDRLPGGALVVDGWLHLRLTAVHEDAEAGRLRALVAAAGAGRKAGPAWAQRVGAWALPLTALAALGAAAFAWHLGPSVALSRAAAVLVVACPCALGLAIPAARSFAAARAMGLGALVKEAEALEALAEAKGVLVDKTGTLTEGRWRLVARLGTPTALAAAAMVSAGSAHPLSQALVQAAGAEGLRPEAPLPGLRAEVGLGVEAPWEGQPLRVGSPAWLKGSGVVLPPLWEAEARAWSARGWAVVGVAHGPVALGLMGLGDGAAPGADGLGDRLAKRGLKVGIASGDAPEAVAWWAERLNIQSAQGGLSPQDKAVLVGTWQAELGGPVVMVGDGWNDAPALAAAGVGVAVARGADLAAESAAVVIPPGRLDALLALLDLARAHRRVVGQNLALAAAYNALAIPLAALGILGPLWAAALMPASALLVLGNAARLLRWKEGPR